MTFSRNLNNWEEKHILNLPTLLSKAYADIQPHGNDKIIWPVEPHRASSVKSLCNKLGYLATGT